VGDVARAFTDFVRVLTDRVLTQGSASVACGSAIPGTLSHLSAGQAVNCTVVQQATAATSAGRFTRPDEVADLVVLLAAAAARTSPAATSSHTEKALVR
jgi:hypothetical protein